MGTEARCSTDLERYRATLRAREARNARASASRRARALRVARAAADVARDFGATRVALFGSLAHERWSSERSDIDLAAWGLGAEAHLLAWARIDEVADGIPVDLVRVEHCPAALRGAIEREGVDV